jgi:hypothetical protein
MTDYQINFVFSYCTIGLSVSAENEDKAVEIAEEIVLDELGLTIPKNCSLEVSEIN